MEPVRDDTNIKVFNTAKLYAEAILFPKMDLYQKFQRQADFGSDDLDKARLLSPDVRDIERYNGLKGMVNTLHNLLRNISSTVRLKGSKDEIDQLDSLLINLDKVETIFAERRDRFFDNVYHEGRVIDTLDVGYFKKIRDMIEIFYINTEILMTKNKLLFSDANDEYKSNEEILQQIKEEYIEG